MDREPKPAAHYEADNPAHETTDESAFPPALLESAHGSRGRTNRSDKQNVVDPVEGTFARIEKPNNGS